jgi:MFS family permease
VGGVVGPVVSGLVLQHLGFNATFIGFAALALLAATAFQLLVPETQKKASDPEQANLHE